jgi:hypothetical protein
MLMRIFIVALDWACWRIWYSQFGYQRPEARWLRLLRRKPQAAKAASGSTLTAAQSGSLTS